MNRSPRSGRFALRLRRRRDERGAYAILFSMMLVLVIALAAIAVDIASQVSSKQHLKDTMDAAAHAAAFELDKDPSRAANEARRVARANDPTANPAIDFWCVVASKGSPPSVNTTQIPSTCNPGPAPYTAGTYPGLVCTDELCFIPCKISATTKCNTIRVGDEDTVPYAFAPAIGYDEGSTGAVVSVACNGPCGKEVPNPLDVVVMADRTASMVTADRQLMKDAILESLKVMNPEMHYVAFGTIAKSRSGGHTRKSNTYGPQTDDYMVENPSCLTGSGCSESSYDKSNKLNFNGHWDGAGKTQLAGTTSTCLSEAQSEAAASTSQDIWKWNTTYGTWPNRYTTPSRPKPSVTKADVLAGTWVPVGFTNDYLHPKATPEDDSVLNNGSNLVDSVSCLSQSMVGELGTQLASALKGAVKYAFDNKPAPDRAGKIRKLIIFETDGEPSEPSANFGNTDLDSGDVVNSNGVTGCSNLESVAAKAKARYKDELVIVTIGFGGAAKNRCGGSGSYVRNVLAKVASDKPGGGPSDANSCTGTDIDLENSDGDYFFCATDGSDLAKIFATAMTSVGGKIKLLKMPA